MADKYKLTSKAARGQTLTQEFGRDRSDSVSPSNRSMEMKGREMKGSVDDLGHTIKGAKANQED